ncbi:poly [ADP-ribose] polymerase 2 isoform X3 [Takifugu rubripes]|nr:poly [ADP-ribose] polymerase 2 isoform X3 [Takifugu rubripes]
MRRQRTARNKNQAVEESPSSDTVWQWQGDEGQWEPYSPSVCTLLNSAVASGNSVHLSLDSGQSYEVDLKKMLQINPVTKYKRKIRCQTVKPETMANAIEESQQSSTRVQIKEEEEEEDTNKQPATKRMRGQTNYEGSPKENPKIEEVVKTVVLKGKAPVDSECKAKLRKAHVYTEGNNVYDVMLNQTNLQFNNNKYYLMQLLEDDKSKFYSVWFRWGRVGKVGQNNLIECGADLNQAKDIFKKKFFDKTKNEWEHRENFMKVAGKYDIVLMDYSADEKEKKNAMVDTKKQASMLDVKIQELLELICDLKAMEECVLEMKFDTQKAPLGKLTSEQIRAGYVALRKIEDCLKKKSSRNELLKACNQFYTRIPHNFGLKTPPIIHTEQELKEKIALLEALSDIQIAVKMVKSNEDGDENPLDRQYRSLHCSLQPLDSSSHEYRVIEKYLQSTHAPTHSDYTMTVIDIFTIDREGESNNFLSHFHNRTLLWHGSRLSNWVSILSQGLRVAPPEAPVTGYMFGKGIYFADMSSKSANYCFANQSNHIGLLLLCEVALGDSNELLDADFEASKLPDGKHSTKGLGQTGPDPKNSLILADVNVPMGPGIKTGVGKHKTYSLLYNEFVVYNPAQIRMRYLLRINFNYSSL